MSSEGGNSRWEGTLRQPGSWGEKAPPQEPFKSLIVLRIFAVGVLKRYFVIHYLRGTFILIISPVLNVYIEVFHPEVIHSYFYIFLYCCQTTSLSDSAVQSDPRPPTDLKSCLTDKEMRQEAIVTTST